MNGMIESARAATVTALEQLVKDGYITSFEEWDSLDEEYDLVDDDIDALYFAAYSESPRSVERLLAELSGSLSGEYRTPIFIVTFKNTKE
jgi:hypothetical protein